MLSAEGCRLVTRSILKKVLSGCFYCGACPVKGVCVVKGARFVKGSCLVKGACLEKAVCLAERACIVKGAFSNEEHLKKTLVGLLLLWGSPSKGGLGK